MAISYPALQSKATALVKAYGLPVTINRAGVKVTSSYGVFVGGTTENENSSKSSLLAQTSVTSKTMLIAPLGKAPEVGDNLIADKTTYIIQKVEITRPAATTLLYKVELQ